MPRSVIASLGMFLSPQSTQTPSAVTRCACHGVKEDIRLLAPPCLPTDHPCLSPPFAYAGHRWLTFRSENEVPREFAAFVGVVILAFLAGTVCVFILVDVLGLPTLLGGLMAAAFPPVVSYIVQARFVFKNIRRGR